VEVVVHLDGLAAVFSGQVERAAAVVVVDEVDAGGGGGAHAGQAVIDVLFAVLAGVACWKIIFNEVLGMRARVKQGDSSIITKVTKAMLFVTV
jgi:hypothetical protein